jgi:hypothetical protein
MHIGHLNVELKYFGLWIRVGIMAMLMLMTKGKGFTISNMTTEMKNGLISKLRGSNSCYFVMKFLDVQRGEGIWQKVEGLINKMEAIPEKKGREK